MQNAAEPDVNIITFEALTPQAYQKSYVTIGNFDGVHLGHQAVISSMVQAAKKQDRPVLVVTFYPNPTLFFKPTEEPFYLSTPREKQERLLSLGIDQVLTVRFDRAFANLSAETFLAALKDKLGLGVLVVGEDFALGKNRQGTIPVITALGETYGFAVETIPQILLTEVEVSSTIIRQMLDIGAVDRAADLLGRPYSVRGEVTHGSDRGARIGLPTANITHWPEKKLPAVGVYATLVRLHQQTYQGITNVGYRPTFEKQTQVYVETHILDFDRNIYGEKFELAFIQKLREEQKFSGVDAFLAQIERDKAKAKRIFKHGKTKTNLFA
jgi:riboflavin kinase / FMN adenylyltransferase